jgi:hypothetical protein
MIRRCLDFLTSQSTRHVLQALVLSGAAKKDMGKLQLVQNRAAHMALRCTQRVNVSDVHVSLSWFNVKERLTASLLVFVQSVDVTELSVQAVGTQFRHSSVQHKTCNLRFLYSTQVQNSGWETHSIKYSHDYMTLSPR